MTLCPGQKRRGASAGDWDRDLAIDLRAVRDFGAAALVTLMETEELAHVRAPAQRFREECRGLGLEWHHLPIVDASTPDETFERLWTYSGARLRRLLRSGQSIVVHCLGGLGRTGLVAARLLIELGENAESAIGRVRTARSGAIETPGQEAYVRRVRPLRTGSGALSSDERALGCLLGGAVGDAFGYAVEFHALDAIRREHGEQGLRTPVFNPEGRLTVSDDTQMTLFTLEGLLRCGDAIADEEEVREALGESYLDWLGTQGDGRPRREPRGDLATAFPELRHPRDPGSTCLSALRSAPPFGGVDAAVNDRKGCGGVMRVAPVGLFVDALSPQEAFDRGAVAAAITHGHPTGYLAAGAMAAIVRLLCDGADLPLAAAEAARLLRNRSDHGETLAALESALRLAAEGERPPLDAVRALGEGWVAEEALAVGLYAALRAETYPDAVRIAANHDGDSDSTASIAGQLWGAWKGLEGIPHDWIVALDALRPTLHLARRFAAASEN